MFDSFAEAARLDRPFALSAAVALDALSQTAAHAADTLRERAARTSENLCAERPRDRLGPRDALIARHNVQSVLRLK